MAATAAAAMLLVGVNAPAGAGAPKCTSYEVHYTNGTSDIGEWCEGGNDVTRAAVPSLKALSLHISCSDNLSAPKKSNLDGLTAATWQIVKHDGKTCSDTDPDGKGDDGKKDKCTFYDFRYTNGSQDTGEWCDGNEVTREDVPTLNAIELHISCSDDFSDPANPKKSVLPAGLVISQWFIQKHDGKTCGTPIHEPEQDITFTCTSVMISGDVPVNHAELGLDDGSTVGIDVGGLASFGLFAPSGRSIDSVTLDGVTTQSDLAGTCQPPSS